MKKRLFLPLLLAGLLFVALPARPAMAQGFEPNFDEGMAAFNYGDNDLALRHFLRLANEGDPRAQYYLAYMMDSGLGMGKDISGASSWYAKSAAQDYLPAMVYMGYITSSGHGTQRDDKKAFEWYRRAAQMGDPIAQNNLATMLRKGIPFAADKPLAAQWFLQSAMQGNMRAQYNLATMYRTADGIKKNAAEALRWYTYAANQGDMYAQYALGYMYLTASKGLIDKVDIAKVAQMDAEKAKDAAKAEEAKKSQEADQREAEQNREQAFEWFRRAAEQGHTAAQMALARMYENGDGGPDRGILDAVIWYQKAADAGNGVAMRRLGELYSGKIKDWNGNGVPMDNKQAYKWLKKAAEEKDDKGAMIEIGQIYEEGAGGFIRDPKKALDWYRQAAETGYPEGMMLLGSMYEKGIGVEVDDSQAYKWYALAAKYYKNSGDYNGQTTAVVNRTRLSIKMQPDDRERINRDVETWQPVVHPKYGTGKEKLYDDSK